MKIDQHTALYMVLGRPIVHSLSPIMQNAAFSAKGINAVYLAFETEDLRDAVRGLRALNIKGASVTIPFKSQIIPYLDEIDPLASRIGAINTIVNGKGRLTGYNTDATGALKALEERISLSGKSCLIIGAGGTARAIGTALKDKGVNIWIANRSSDRGKSLAASLGCPFIQLKDLGDIQTDLMIQTTPVGMYPDVELCLVPEHMLKKGVVVMDVIYNPIETKLLRLAKRNGCHTINGLHMFVFQGSEQFRIWTGLDPPIDLMTQTVQKALEKRL
jgi:shikimate dehydrogenase